MFRVLPEFCLLLFVLFIDDGFRLTYLGYDFLAIKTLVNRGVFSAVGRQIGVGKESGLILNACCFVLFCFLNAVNSMLLFMHD